jgi:MoxR-like ATPase
MQDDVQLIMVTSARQLMDLRQAVESVFVDADLEVYIAQLVHETRVDRRVAVGGSPRASLAFLKMARARAALEGRDFILPDDIKHFAQPVLGHRLILQPEYWMARRVADEVIHDVLDKVPVPVVKRS